MGDSSLEKGSDCPVGDEETAPDLYVTTPALTAPHQDLAAEAGPCDTAGSRQKRSCKKKKKSKKCKKCKPDCKCKSDCKCKKSDCCGDDCCCCD